jgi:hypothetical protein
MAARGFEGLQAVRKRRGRFSQVACWLSNSEINERNPSSMKAFLSLLRRIYRTVSWRKNMSMRLAATTAFALLLSGPAFADCKEELNNLDQAAVSAQTGAGSDPGAPMTKHQKEVLGSKQQASDREMTGSDVR